MIKQKECDFCKNFNWGQASTMTRNGRSYIRHAGSSYCFPPKEQFNYCPVCGKPNYKKEGQIMNKELQSAFNVVVKYGFCCDCRYYLDSRDCEETMCYRDVNLIRDALEAFSKIEEMPSADVATVIHGKWAHLGGDEWCCTNCGFVITTEGRWEKPTDKYCSNCGAKMDLDDE